MISCNELNNYNYISFDLFDTLIFRGFSSYDKVFDFVEYQYNLAHDNKITKFKTNRIKAEKKARKKANYQEVTLDEIYDELNLDIETKNEIKSIEKMVEVSTSLPNREMIDVLNRLNAEGKTIIITTDMYLPEETILKILTRHGITYTHVFVSGEFKKTKQQGDLFLLVLSKLGIKEPELIHIGDNKNSDYEIPKKIGIDAVLYNRKIIDFPYMLNSNNTLADHYNSLIRNGFIDLNQEYADEYKIGFSVMGPVITSFCNWIHDIKQTKNLDGMLFLAREGYAIQNIYEILFPEEKQVVRYARINKHILRVPLLTKDNLSGLLKSTLKNNKQSSWRYIFESLGISNIEGISLPDGQNLDSIITIEDLDTARYEKVQDDILKLLSDEVASQSALLVGYLNDLDICNRKIGLINNSYSGNGQKLLTKFGEQQNMNLDLLGIQFAADKSCKKALGDKYVTWLNDQSDSMMAYLFERGSLIFEHLLFEPSGTAIKLDKAESGKPFVVCEQTRTEQQDFEKIAAYQAGMKDFAKIVKDDVECDIGALGMQYFVNLIQNPTRKDALLLGNLHDDDTDIDRLINNYDEDFNLGYLYKNDIYNRVSWVQGFLKVKGAPDIMRNLFNIRLYLTHYFHNAKR